MFRQNDSHLVAGVKTLTRLWEVNQIHNVSNPCQTEEYISDYCDVLLFKIFEIVKPFKGLEDLALHLNLKCLKEFETRPVIIILKCYASLIKFINNV